MPVVISEPEVTFVIKMHYGSHVYGTSLPTSDIDVKGIFIPLAREILLQRVQDTFVASSKLDKSKPNSPGDTDFELFSLQRFVQLLLDGQTVALDMLFTPESFYLMQPHPAWLELRKEREKFLHRGVAAIARYCQRQAAKYGIKGSRIATLRKILRFLKTLDEKTRLRDHQDKLETFVRTQVSNGEPPARIVTVEETHRSHPGLYLDVCDRKVPLDAHVKLAKNIYQKTLDEYGERALLAEKNEGVDWKALMHAVRVAHEAKELLITGKIEFPRPERELLLKIRRGELPYKEVAAKIETGLEELEEAQHRSVLEVSPDRIFADDFVLKYYKTSVVG